MRFETTDRLGPVQRVERPTCMHCTHSFEALWLRCHWQWSVCQSGISDTTILLIMQPSAGAKKKPRQNKTKQTISPCQAATVLAWAGARQMDVNLAIRILTGNDIWLGSHGVSRLKVETFNLHSQYQILFLSLS